MAADYPFLLPNAHLRRLVVRYCFPCPCRWHTSCLTSHFFLVTFLKFSSLRKTSCGPDKCQLVNYSMLTKVLHKYNQTLLVGNGEVKKKVGDASKQCKKKGWTLKNGEKKNYV